MTLRDVWNRFTRKHRITKNIVRQCKASSEVQAKHVDRIVFLPKEKLHNHEYLTEELLAVECGYFSSVVTGVYKKRNGETIKAAFKSPRITEDTEETMRNKLLVLEELKILSYIGEHENIVRLIETITINNTVQGVMEMCETSLDNYLRQYRCYFMDAQCKPSRPNCPTSGNYVRFEPFKTLDLIRWSLQIASGMLHLASVMIVHRDVAIRNMLLIYKNGQLDVRITNFALSKKLSEKDGSYETTSGGESLPWRHLAPELFETRKLFSEATDVWAFGITLWQIFNLAQQQPYHEYEICDQRFVRAILKKHVVNSKPPYAETDIYEIMCKCWNREPTNRPKFTELVQMFSHILHSVQVKTSPHPLRSCATYVEVQ